MNLEVLHQPLTIGGTTTVPNRLYRAPVLEGAGNDVDCAERYARSFVPNAESGVGLIIQGSASITAEGRTSPGMTCVDTRERVLRLAPLVAAVHHAGAAIWLQAGHGGLYAMEGWHEPYASHRTEPLRLVSPLRPFLRPAFRRVPKAVMTTEEVYAMARTYGDVAAWAREAGYDGMQLASSNAKLLDQFLSPFYNQRTDEFGGSTEARARVLRIIRQQVAERAGPDFTCSVKVPMGEKAPPFMAHTTFAEGLEVARLCQEWGFDSITPVQVSVLPDTTLSRGGIPRSIWNNPAITTRLRRAAPRRLDRWLIQAGYVLGGIQSPFEPVWNRPCFIAASAVLAVPVFAVGGIRSSDEVRDILNRGEAAMVGIGRPFYAEPDLAARIMGSDRAHEPGACVSSNLCVPAQMMGMKGVCYNPAVVKLEAERRRGPTRDEN